MCSFNWYYTESLFSIVTKDLLVFVHDNITQSIGNPGSLCVTRDITQVNYREHMRRS